MIETVIAVAVYSFFEPYWLKIKQLELDSEKIPTSFDGKTVVFVSDIHCGKTFSLNRVRGLVKKINRLRPDIIILGGDYISHDASKILPVFKEFKKFKPTIATFGVLGNHDCDCDIDLSRKGMRDAGIKSLDNRGCWVSVGDGRIRLGGVGDRSAGPQDVEATLEETTPEDFVILISHNPSFIKEVPENSVDFMLSGHTHGGQIAPLGLFGPILSLSKYGFRSKHRCGIVDENGVKMFVSSGIGAVMLPVRLMANPEIVHITLKRSV